MKVEELVKYYPQLYHMAETGTWDSIRKRGLLSTTALLDLFEVNGLKRRAIESERRSESVSITHPLYGKAVIRDQKPMSEKALLKCLQDGIPPAAWYETLNKRVFFWLSKERLERLLAARAYRGKQHCVLTIDCAELVTAHHKEITLSPINSGSTIYTPQPRGKSTFRRIEEYPFEIWAAKRSITNAVVELVVDYSVPNLAKYVLKVEEWNDGKSIKTVFARK